MYFIFRAAALVCCLAIGLNAWPAEAKRVALVIGVGDHLHLPKLKNPVNDATDVAEALTKLDFKVVLKKDVGFGDMRAALRDLSREASGAEAAVVFFAGNGVAVGSVDYLIPRDAKLDKDTNIDLEAIKLETVLSHVADAALGLVIFDACRDYPLRLAGTGDTRGVHRGIAPKGMATTPVKIRPFKETLNRFVLYAGEPGKTVQDGKDRNSPFTAALLKHLATPGLELRQLVVRVRRDVLDTTSRAQRPTYDDSFNGEFFFKAAKQ